MVLNVGWETEIQEWIQILAWCFFKTDLLNPKTIHPGPDIFRLEEAKNQELVELLFMSFLESKFWFVVGVGGVHLGGILRFLWGGL